MLWNIVVQISFELLFSLGRVYISRSGIVQSYDSPDEFLRNPCCFKSDVTRVSSSPRIDITFICGLFNDSCSDRYDMISHCGFDLCLMVSYVAHLFMCLLIIYMSLQKCLFRFSASLPIFQLRNLVFMLFYKSFGYLKY